MIRRQQSRPRLRLTLKLVYFVPVISVLVLAILVLFFNFTAPKKAEAATETMTTGSFIIDMGKSPQTVSNGLRPYGMVYDLMINYSVPIKWIIEPTKAKDGTDFTYSATAYKGGPFIVPKEYITSAVTARITYWAGKGVQGVYTTSNINVPVYATITNWPRMIIDNVSGNEGIITNYFDNAMIPSTAYSIGTPSLLTYCHDMWANPHGDPTWATHGYLYNLVTVAKSYIWMQCHAVSVTEGVKNTSSPFEQLDFLTTNGLKCYGAGSCGAPITESHAGNATAPFTHNYPTDPVMQFIGTMDGASDGGSEKWYQPQSTGAWRGTTKRLVTTSTGASPNEGVLMAYGPAFGNAANGTVMYEAGHNIDGNGSTAEKVAAQRAFFNFVLYAGINKQIVFNTQTSPASLMGNETGSCTVTVSGGSGGFSYSWSSTVGGSFSAGNSANATFTAPVVSSTTTGSLICSVTDTCGRRNFISRPITISTQVLPIELKKLDAEYNGKGVDITWTTASEINNDYFSIEHSTDGIHYTDIGKVNGSGNSTSDISYKFTHESPSQSYNYYKLRQTDYDGTKETFGPVYVKINKLQNTFAITDVGPNPFNDRININYSLDKEGEASFTLVNATGAVVRTDKLQSGAGQSSYEFSGLESLPTGIYYAILTSGENKKVVKILKNR